jgi:hypothetical protein
MMNLAVQQWNDGQATGKDIKALQFGWLVGVPLARKMVNQLRELRSSLSDGLARIFCNAAAAHVAHSAAMLHSSS